MTTKLVLEVKDLENEEWLRRLQMTTLEQRRARDNVLEAFRIICGLLNNGCSQFFKYVSRDSRVYIRGQSYKPVNLSCKKKKIYI